MEVPYDVVMYVNENCPYYLYPVVSFVMGLLHLFPPCCIISFVLGEIGQSLTTLFPKTNWDWEIFNGMESDYYDEWRKMHVCCFHAKQTENMQSYRYDERPWWWRLAV